MDLYPGSQYAGTTASTTSSSLLTQSLHGAVVCQCATLHQKKHTLFENCEGLLSRVSFPARASAHDGYIYRIYRGHLSDHNIVTQTSPVVAYSRTHAYMHHLLLHKSLRYDDVSKHIGQKTRRPSTMTPQRHTEPQNGRKLLITQTAVMIWKCKAESAHLSFRGLEVHPPYQVSRMRSNPCVGKHRPSWHGESPAVALRLLHDCIPWQRPGSQHSSKLQPQLSSCTRSHAGYHYTVWPVCALPLARG